MPQLGEGDEQVGEHAGALAALAGEEERDLARGSGRGRPVGPAGRRPRRRVVLAGQRPPQQRRPARPGRGRRPRPAPARTGRPPRRARRARGRAAARAGRPVRRRSARRSSSCSDGRWAAAPVRAAEAGTARPARRPGAWPAAPARRRRRASTAWKLVPPKPNALTPATVRAAGAGPRAGLGVEAERAAAARARPGWAVPGAGWAAGRRGSRAERGLDQPGQPGGALGVADLRLHRAERAAARLRAGLGEHLGQRRQLGAVADDGAGAVRLDQPDLGAARRRRCGRPAPAPRRWPSGRGAVRPRSRPSLEPPTPLMTRVDPVAVALGVGQPLEDDAGDALAERDAVGRCVEGAAPAGGRERVHRGEQQVVVDAVVQVGAAAQHRRRWSPPTSSLQATSTAASEEAQAASTV